MAKYDPIVSEFESEEAEAAYDKWFRAEVKAGLKSEGPWHTHEEVMKEAREIIERAKAKESAEAKHARRSLGR